MSSPVTPEALVQAVISVTRDQYRPTITNVRRRLEQVCGGEVSELEVLTLCRRTSELIVDVVHDPSGGRSMTTVIGLKNPGAQGRGLDPNVGPLLHYHRPLRSLPL
jgi:hypothetical protein